MNDIIEALNFLVQDISKNTSIRFIVKKNSESLSIKAYKKLCIELYFHTPYNNKLCLHSQTIVNSSKLDEAAMWDILFREFYKQLFLWIYNGGINSVIHGI